MFNQLHPLVFMFVLLHQYKQFFKHSQPWFLQLTCIHSLSVGLEPIEHIMLLDAVTRWIMVVGLYELYHLIVFYQPTSILIHDTFFLNSMFHAKLVSYI